MHVAQQRQRILVRIDQMRLEAALKQVPAARSPPIEAHRESGLQPAQSGAQIGPGSLHDQVVMIGIRQ